ncbi:methylmalonyl-CoA mutase family protein [Neobacillus dielmonensis]|uniref:methylmalonyl-CoA mutase family protein n=1 Tax=Neobacillus dielmonensis TaxID=1347369 RepID=UPI0005A9F8DE|nr:methylmalonyl-CoA mutase family protein [Neobacillus dielmonensis]
MQNIRNQSFPFPLFQEWEERARESLKGKPLETLESVTYENITLKPIYTQDDEQVVPQYPGGSDWRRGINPLGYLTREWKIAQRIKAVTPRELRDRLRVAFENGQTAISFEVTKGLIESNSYLEFCSHSPFAINSKWDYAEFLTYLLNKQHVAGEVTGYIANDPLSLSAERGELDQNLLKSWPDYIVKANQYLPKLRTVLVDMSSYHNGGASAVQEIGIAAATGIFYLEKLMEAGLELDKVLSRMVFQFSVGSEFFTELAKIRAARIVWGRITSLFGAKPQMQGMEIAAETSQFTMTLTDPHVNLLRTANQAFAAVLAGVQWLHITPFDEITGSTPLSERIARNVQLILKEEAQLKKIIDPAGGSWYLESLTNQLAEEAWKFFQEIESKGGILEVLQNNWLQEQIETVFIKRNKDVLTRKRSIVGTNVYAKVDESLPELVQTNQGYDQEDAGFGLGIPFTKIPQRRLSEPFEQLRNRVKRLEAKMGVSVTVGMLCLGELKQHKPRLDFMKGFLAAGGIQTIESSQLFHLEHAIQFLQQEQPKWVCICGTNDQYEQIGHELLASIKTAFPNLFICLAGLPEKGKQEQWEKEGIEQFIHTKSNCYETISAILTSLEVSSIEETKA